MREGDELILDFSDDGPGFPPGFSLSKPVSAGYRMLMRIVVEKSAHVEIRLKLPAEYPGIRG